MTRSAILKCVCRHAGQDAAHGGGERAHNPLAVADAKNKIRKYRCTVCGAERDAGDERIKAPKDVEPKADEPNVKPNGRVGR